jgi:hypothetical protein
MDILDNRLQLIDREGMLYSRSQLVELVSRHQIASAQHMLHLVRHKHSLKLLRQPSCPVRHVCVAYNQHELSKITHLLNPLVFDCLWVQMLVLQAVALV